MSAVEPHRRRRNVLMDQCGEGLILVRGLAANGCHANFFYLTGLDEPRAALLLAPSGVRVGTGRNHPGRDYVSGRMVRQALFLPAGDAMAARWGEQGSATVASLSAEQAGVDVVLEVEELAPILAAALPSTPVLHYVRGAPPTLSGPDDPDVEFVARLRRRFFGLTIEDLSPAVHELRRVKDDDEVAAIEGAAAVTAQAVRIVASLLRPGIREYEIEAEVGRIYRAHGGRHAFDPIVAAGPRALMLHYRRNSGTAEPGQLLLLDTGVTLGGYAADVTRTLPVDGRFTERQRRVYEVVLEAQQAAIALCRPGASLGEIHARAFDAIAGAGLGERFVHGTSHHLGLEVHDVGDVHRPLVAGNVLTVEPGVYLPDEGLGIRIEDDVLVTESGPRVLTEAIPRTVQAVEQMMTERR